MKVRGVPAIAIVVALTLAVVLVDTGQPLSHNCPGCSLLQNAVLDPLLPFIFY